jgi:copper(I)-binding protein
MSAVNKSIDRRAVLQTGLALCASLVAAPIRACEFFTTTMRITHPWTRDTGPDAFAVLCMKFDQVSETDRLIGVETPVAAAAELVTELGVGTAVNLVIPQDRETVLSEQGTHIRLLELRHPLAVGRSYPLALTFEKGGTVVAQLNVDYDRPLMRFK